MALTPPYTIKALSWSNASGYQEYAVPAGYRFIARDLEVFFLSPVTNDRLDFGAKVAGPFFRYYLPTAGQQVSWRGRQAFDSLEVVQVWTSGVSFGRLTGYLFSAVA